MRRALIGGTGLLLVLLLVLLANAALLRSPVEPPPTALQPAPPLDLARAAAHLGEAIRFQTVSHQDPAQDDPRAWADLRAWIGRTYPHFLAVAREESFGGGALLFTWPGTRRDLAPIVLMAHQDVVPADAAGWRRPPFAGAAADGAVWGRGALDDKGSLVACLEALDALAAQGLRPARSVLLVSGEHEETTGGSIPLVAAALAKRDVHALFVLDEGLSILDPAPVADRPVALVGVAEKGYATLRLTARGQGGHSSMPPRDTAATSLARALVALADHPAPLRLEGVSAEMLQALAAVGPFPARLLVGNAWLFRPLVLRLAGSTPAGAAALRTTLAPTMLAGSPKDNVLPETAVARVNVRILPGDRSAAVVERARAAVRGLPVAVDLDGPTTEPSAPASPRSGAFRVIAALAKDIDGLPTAPGLMIGGTDSRRMSAISPDVLTFTYVRLTEVDRAGFHGRDERLSLENLRRLETFYARLIATTAQG